MVPFHAAQVIPLEERGLGLGEAFNMRLDELKVVDIAFLGELLVTHFARMCSISVFCQVEAVQQL